MIVPPYTYTTDRVTTHPASSPTGGPDRRIRVTDASDYMFHRSVSTGGGQSQTAIEVQAFTPDQYRAAIVALVTFVSESEHNLSGQADILLSPAEARAIAQSLIIAAAEAEALDVLARQAVSA